MFPCPQNVTRAAQGRVSSRGLNFASPIMAQNGCCHVSLIWCGQLVELRFCFGPRRFGFDRFHVCIRKAKMMANLVNENMDNEITQGFVMFGPVIQ